MLLEQYSNNTIGFIYFFDKLTLVEFYKYRNIVKLDNRILKNIKVYI